MTVKKKERLDELRLLENSWLIVLVIIISHKSFYKIKFKQRYT